MIDRNATLRKNAEFGSRKIVRPIILPKIIALFGAGQLGSRHLQALAKIDMPVKIYVIDPSDNALQIAHERYLEIPKNEEILKIEFLSKHSEMDEIHTNIDLCIIATNADVRYQVFQEIISARMVSNIIFEKIVFQSVRDFEKASKLLIEKHISCWVNYPRRLFSIYEELKPLFFKKMKELISPLLEAIGGLHVMEYILLIFCFILLAIQNIILISQGWIHAYGRARGPGLLKLQGR